MNKKTKLIIIIGIALVLIIGLTILFTHKASKNKKFVEDENNYSLKFNYYLNNEVTQTITFIYRDKKLKDITITLYYDSVEVAKAVYKVYKEQNEFKKYEREKKKVILYYKDDEVKDYLSYTKDEIIDEFTSMGYTYMSKK